MEKKKMVIFDFDGVIVNTHEVSFALNQATNPHLTEELYSQMSHGNFFASFESEQPILTFTPNPVFREEYRKGILMLPMPKTLKDTIARLASKYTLVICSSAFDETIREFLKKETIDAHFEAVYGVMVHKSKVMKFQQLLERFSLEKGEVVFITDTLGDILEAHEAGIKTIAETWGLHSREILEKGKPEIIIDEIHELEGVIDRILIS